MQAETMRMMRRIAASGGRLAEATVQAEYERGLLSRRDWSQAVKLGYVVVALGRLGQDYLLTDTGLKRLGQAEQAGNIIAEEVFQRYMHEAVAKDDTVMLRDLTQLWER